MRDEKCKQLAVKEQNVMKLVVLDVKYQNLNILENEEYN